MIKKNTIFFCLTICLWVNGFAAKSSTKNLIDTNALFKTKQVLATMEKVANWQLDDWKVQKMKWPLWDWTNATCYAGLADLSSISKNKIYQNHLVSTGEALNWNTGPRRFYADDYCIGQTYSILYSRLKEPKMIENWRLQADSILAKPHTESLEWKNSVRLREWAWCDALFMGPPALAYLSTATQDQKYLDLAVELWWKTTAYLYDEKERLYSRDGSYLDKKEKNGQKVFWSRGNGWVMGGLVRMLENMPQNHKDRIKFEQLYRSMAERIISLQQPDGSWHASLLDPTSFNVKETSGTGFYCYALLWGMNHNLIDKKATWPVVKRAWSALSTSVKPNGMLGYVQAVGASPDKVDENSTEVFGTGAFLLAGVQLYRFIQDNKKYRSINIF